MNGNQLTLTATNPSIDRPREAEILIHGGTARAVAGVTLAASDPRAHNTFADPRAVEPKPVAVTLKGSSLIHQFPPASVTKLTVTL